MLRSVSTFSLTSCSLSQYATSCDEPVREGAADLVSPDQPSSSSSSMGAPPRSDTTKLVGEYRKIRGTMEDAMVVLAKDVLQTQSLIDANKHMLMKESYNLNNRVQGESNMRATSLDFPRVSY